MTNTDGKKYRLGIDLGTSSIGWAAISLDESGDPCGVLDMGVRIFPDGRKPTDETSRAVDRRMARGQRRRRDRYLKRRSRLMQALIDYSLLPPDENRRRELVRLDPYALRARALDHPLKPHELGRALFHLDQRRGFKSNRKAGNEDEAEGRKLSAAIGTMRRSIEESGARTLGDFLARRHEKGETVRARPDLGIYPDREMYEAEFNAIRTAQAPYHRLRSEHWEHLHNIIFYQLPLRPVEPGWCSFENGERRAARALPMFQEFRILQEVNNLTLQVGTETDRPLDERERERALSRLRSGKDINLQKPTKSLGLPSGATFNLARFGRKAIKGDETTARLAKDELFGERWIDISLSQRNGIIRFLLDTEVPEIVLRKAEVEWGLDKPSADTLANAAFVDGYGNLSEKAIQKLLPHLEQGLGYSDAVIASGYPHHSDFRNAEAHDRLPYYGQVLERDTVGADPEKDPDKDGEPAHYGRIGNPTVHIGLNQLRRVVNRLIETYGKPQDIVVELARDLKMNRAQKQDLRQRQQAGRMRNERLKEMLESAGIPGTQHTRAKLRLWDEQVPPHTRVCPFTGTPLSFNMVVSNQTEIEHILPWSRTLDDSPANKVVCTIKANRDKGNRSPHEAFGHSPPGYDYQEILERAAKLPGNKRWRFQQDAMERFEDEAGFLDRQLNETRYLSRTARAYLAHLYDEKGEGRERVRAAPGRLTALLRRGWGLEGMLRVTDEDEIIRKQRDDHRHHAIDAFVLANTTPGLLRRFARAASFKHSFDLDKLASLAPPPWEGFHRSQLKAILDRIVVSFKPDHGTRGIQGKTTGQLHKETAYGLIELSEDGPSKVVVRKVLGAFKKRGDLDSVRDPALRRALQELWDQVGSKPAEFAQQASTRGILINGRLQPVRRARVIDEQRVIPIADTTGKSYKAYLPGGNEFVDIWRMRDGNWQMVVVPTFYANQPGFDLEIYRPMDKSSRKDPTAKRLARLQIDDMGALGEGPERRIARLRKITNAKDGVRVYLDEHNEANVAARIAEKELKEIKYSATRLRKQGFRKIGVDEIGRVLDPGPLA